MINAERELQAGATKSTFNSWNYESNINDETKKIETASRVRYKKFTLLNWLIKTFSHLGRIFKAEQEVWKRGTKVWFEQDSGLWYCKKNKTNEEYWFINSASR